MTLTNLLPHETSTAHLIAPCGGRLVNLLVTDADERDDPEFRAKLGRAMLTSIQAWDWKCQAEYYRAMFEAILNNPH